MRLFALISLLLYLTLVESRLSVWTTQGNKGKLLERGADLTPSKPSKPATPITINPNIRFQSIKGFGAAISNSAAYLIQNSPVKDDIIRDLFDPSEGRGISYIRFVMGGSDFNAVEPYTYDDIDPQYEDFELEHFSIDKDREFVLPLMKEIVRVHPGIGIIASPWSAPAWMKTNKNLSGGSLRNDHRVFNTLAEYFVRFVKAYAEEGITIDALTLQNEPNYQTDGYPTMIMTSHQQQRLVKLIGQAFEKNNMKTEIILYDHNWDDIQYPLTILADPQARKYVGGTAWHCYGGDRNAPRNVTSRYPETDVYFTECSGGEWDKNFASSLGWNLENLFIGQTRVGARVVLLWNMALDSHFGPRVGVTGGCANCRGVVTVDGGSYERNVEYYVIAHFSSFVKKGAKRIESTRYNGRLDTVAFQNPDKSIVLIVFNASWGQTETFDIKLSGDIYRYENIPPRTVATFVSTRD